MSLQRRLPTPAEPTRFLYLGRLTPEKNVDLLIRAIGEIESRQGDMDPASLGAAELWIAGDGPERARLERLVAQAGLQERVRFLGMQSRIRPLFEHCQALVMASDYEGLPMAVLEAGASAMPVIAPPVGGLPAVLDDGCGYLVESPSLAEAMLRVMRDPVASQQVGARLRARVESRFSMRHCLDRHIELYQAVLR
ncbi:MAG: glycosyltransferase family 4 protein [Burkholderiaceae bacterium]